MRGSRASAGLRQADAGHHGERFGVDVGLQEPVEQHQPVRAGLVEPQRHLAGRAEVRAQLDRDRHGHRVLDPRQDVEVALLDVAAGDVRVAGEVVDVQLDRGGAGVLHRPRVVGPAAGRDAVEAGDHRDVDGGRGALEQAQVAARAGLLLGGGREVGQRLGEALGAGVGQPRVPRRLAAQLLLEQRVEHHRADAGVGQAPHAVHGLRQRRRRRDERVAQGEAHVARSPGPSAILASVGREAVRAAGRHLLVDLPALGDGLLGQPVQAFGLGRVGVRQRAVAQLAVGVVGQRDARPRRVEQERVAAGRAHHRVVADQRPVPAGDRAVLLVEPVAHLDAVRDAVAVGDHQRRPVVGLGLAERLQRLLRDRRPSRPGRRRRCRRRSPAARGLSSARSCRRRRTWRPRPAASTWTSGRRCWSRPRCRAPAR